jgi:hypothetical protein
MSEDKLNILERSAVQAHINMLQGIINRMASNSANCKTWAITILAAMLVLVVENKICSDKLWVCYIPIGLFFFLDCFYLGLERNFIKKQNDFISKIHNGENFENELFVVKKLNEKWYQKVWAAIKKFFCQLLWTLKAIFSFSIIPFYVAIFVLLYFLIK